MSTGVYGPRRAKVDQAGCATRREANVCHGRKIGREPATTDRCADGNLAHRATARREINSSMSMDDPASKIRRVLGVTKPTASDLKLIYINTRRTLSEFKI
jgi:hypothetical protein